MRTFKRRYGTRLALLNAFPPVNWRAIFRGAFGTSIAWAGGGWAGRALASLALLGRRFLLNHNLQMRGHVLMQLHRHAELTQGLQRLVELDLLPVQIDSLLHDGFGNVARSDRPEQLIGLARPLLERSRKPLELLGQFFSLRLLLGRLPHRSGL